MDGRLEDGQPVSVAVRETLSAAGERLVSTVTAYEIGVKATIGKLATPDDLDERLEDFGIGRLAITWAHTRAASQLPLRHRDSGHAADPDCALRFADAAAAMRTLLTDDPAAVDEAIEAETLRIDGSALVAGWFAGMIKRLMMIGRWRVERRPLPHPYVHHDPSMWEKATTPDDWSSAGEPHPWWDRDSTPPTCAFPRFDLFESAYALTIMSDVTPAWREVYARIADGLVARHTTFWAAIDWLTLIGPDPRRDSYPPEWHYLLPEPLRGRYEGPGWTANGIEPWGLQPDPIGADGNLFFRGFLNLLLGLYRYIAGDDKWDRPFPVTGYREREFEWSHSRITEFLTLQMEERPQGPHCENTKIYPHCVSGAGAGLQLYDALRGTDNQRVYHRWVDFAKQRYMETKRGEPSWGATYYDPLQEVAHVMPGQGSALMMLEATPSMYPADREFVGQLYEMAMRRLGWSDRRKPSPPTPAASTCRPEQTRPRSPCSSGC